MDVRLVSISVMLLTLPLPPSCPRSHPFTFSSLLASALIQSCAHLSPLSSSSAFNISVPDDLNRHLPPPRSPPRSSHPASASITSSFHSVPAGETEGTLVSSQKPSDLWTETVTSVVCSLINTLILIDLMCRRGAVDSVMELLLLDCVYVCELILSAFLCLFAHLLASNYPPAGRTEYFELNWMSHESHESISKNNSTRTITREPRTCAGTGCVFNVSPLFYFSAQVMWKKINPLFLFHFLDSIFLLVTLPTYPYRGLPYVHAEASKSRLKFIYIQPLVPHERSPRWPPWRCVSLLHSTSSVSFI